MDPTKNKPTPANLEETVRSSVPAASPIEHSRTNVIFPTGWGGTEPLPAMIANGTMQTAWVIGKAARKALRENGYMISVVISNAKDGTPVVSVAIPKTSFKADN